MERSGQQQSRRSQRARVLGFWLGSQEGHKWWGAGPVGSGGFLCLPMRQGSCLERIPGSHVGKCVSLLQLQEVRMPQLLSYATPHLLQVPWALHSAQHVGGNTPSPPLSQVAPPHPLPGSNGQAGQHMRKTVFPVETRESRHNSRNATWFPRHRKMRPLPPTASQEKSHVPS